MKNINGYYIFKNPKLHICKKNKTKIFPNAKLIKSERNAKH